MTTKIRPGILLLFLLFPGVQMAWSQSEKSAAFGEGKTLKYTIKNWFQGKDAAVSLTFDDGFQSQFKLALPVMNRRAFKGTFFIVTNRVGKGYTPCWDSIRFLSNQGHEIGSHSLNHANFDSLVNNPAYSDSLKSELLNSMRIIDKYLPFQKCRSFAWPFGKVNEKAISFAKKYYLQARSSYNNYEVIDPVNMLCLSSQHVYSNTQLKTMNMWVNEVLRFNGWLIERYHGFRSQNDTNGYEPADINAFERHLDYLKGYEKILWVAPMGTVAAYIRERKCTNIKVVSSAGSGLTLALFNALPDSLNTVPLTVSIQLDGNLGYLTAVKQNGKVVPFLKKHIGNKDFAIFDEYPNQGSFELHVALLSFSTNPQPFKRKTDISFSLSEPQKVRVRVTDSAGKNVQVWEDNYPAGNNSLCFNASKLPEGEYTCWLEIAGQSFPIRMEHIQ